VIDTEVGGILENVFGARATEDVYSSNIASTLFDSDFRCSFRSTDRLGMMGPYVLDCTPDELLFRRGLCKGLGLMRSSTGGFLDSSFPFDMMLLLLFYSFFYSGFERSSTLLLRIVVSRNSPQIMSPETTVRRIVASQRFQQSTFV